MSTTYWRLPSPEPYQGPARCPTCAGARLTTDSVQFNPGSGDKVLIAEIICPTCGGCGRAEHDGCQPEEHADWDPHDDPSDDELDEDLAQAKACPFCHGRRWWVSQAFGGEEVYDLRVACGCAADLLVEVQRAA